MDPERRKKKESKHSSRSPHIALRRDWRNSQFEFVAISCNSYYHNTRKEKGRGKERGKTNSYVPARIVRVLLDISCLSSNHDMPLFNRSIQASK